MVWNGHGRCSEALVPPTIARKWAESLAIEENYWQ